MNDLAQLDSLASVRSRLIEAIGQRVIGQAATVDGVLIAVLAGGHAMLVGAPGLAKTLLVGAISDALGWSFRRIQFTPDLMPADITGSDVLREDRASGARSLSFMPGPVFANIVLADEINRTPPKTQAALLEAMQERAVTIGGTTHQLPQPFFVLATQNPIEQEGTYPLPEAQLDRFLACVWVDYPSEAEELAIAAMDTRRKAPISPVITMEEFQQLSELVARIPVPAVALRHAVELARASRPGPDSAPWVREHLAWGAGPRATQALIAASRAYAALRGSPAVGIAEVRACAPLVLAHRMVPSFQAAGAGIDGRAIVKHLLDTIKP